ncbi:hypothetical protein [Gelidibacter mesophilus]|uniref:hypothetical protein n=1 Tax=Gelidibacter mesophilus TaxID=169050 RepID=UPI0012F742D1|nr:hypothetical protein [Gelidibacter mesophilus]
MTPSKNSHCISVSIKLMLLTFISLTLFTCKNKEEKLNKMVTEESIVEEVVITPTLEKGCYTYHENGSMVSMEITKADNPVEGNLTYAFAEKDKNTGTFKGEFNDGKLVADYTFQSEGKESTRQVAFMLKDNQLVEGYGELNENGTMFKDVNFIDYSSTTPLTKTDCKQ